MGSRLPAYEPRRFFARPIHPVGKDDASDSYAHNIECNPEVADFSSGLHRPVASVALLHSSTGTSTHLLSAARLYFTVARKIEDREPQFARTRHSVAIIVLFVLLKQLKKEKSKKQKEIAIGLSSALRRFPVP